VEVGLRLLAGHMSYQTALLVLLLTPEAYLPLRAVGAQFHASTERPAAARDVFEILDTPAPQVTPVPAGTGRPVSLRTDAIKLTGVSLAYPGRGRDALSAVNLTIRPGRAGRARARCWRCCSASPRPPRGGSRSAAWTWRPYHCRPGAARSAGCPSSRTCSPRRWPTTSRWATRRPAVRPSPRRPGRPGRPPSSKVCRRATP